MEHSTEVFVGIDVAKSRYAIAIADGERGGEVRYFGEVDAAPEAMRRVVQRIAAKHGRAHFCYEGWPHRLRSLSVDHLHGPSVRRDRAIPNSKEAQR